MNNFVKFYHSNRNKDLDDDQNMHASLQSALHLILASGEGTLSDVHAVMEAHENEYFHMFKESAVQQKMTS